jgi:hypothetical protein
MKASATVPDVVRSRHVAFAAVGLALAALVVLAFVPIVATQSAVTSVGSDGGAGETLVRSSHETFVERGGLGALALLAIPAVLALVPALIWRGRAGRVAAWSSAAVLLLLVLATGFTIGLFYLPAAGVALAAAAVRQGSR